MSGDGFLQSILYLELLYGEIYSLTRAIKLKELPPYHLIWLLAAMCLSKCRGAHI